MALVAYYARHGSDFTEALARVKEPAVPYPATMMATLRRQRRPRGLSEGKWVDYRKTTQTVDMA